MGTCKWIEGEDYLEKIRAGRTNIYCGKPTVSPSSSWCKKHMAKVYHKSQDQAKASIEAYAKHAGPPSRG